MADEAVRLPIDFGDGPQKAGELRSRVDELRAEVVDLHESYERGGVTYAVYQERMRELGSELNRLATTADKEERDRQRRDAADAARAEREAQRAQRTADAAAKAAERKATAEERAAARQSEAQERAYRAMQREMDRLAAAADRASGRAGGGGMVGLGQSVLQASRGIQDFQAAGLMGVVNNIEGLALALGLGNGVAGVATLALVGLQVLRPMLQGTGDDAKDAADLVGALNERIKELEAKPLKLEADYEAIAVARTEVELLQGAKDALDKAMGKQTQNESESGKAVGEAIEAAEMRPVIAAARERQVEQAVAKDVGLRNAAQRAMETGQEAERTKEALDAAIAGNADADTIRFAEMRAIRAAQAAKAAESARDDLRRKIEAETRAAQNEATKAAREGVGEAQAAGQQFLQDMLRDQGVLGAQAARKIGQAAPENMPAKRAAEEKAKRDKTAAEAAKREAEREAEQEARRRAQLTLDMQADGTEIVGNRLKDAAAARDKARKDAEREREKAEREAAQGADRIARGFAGSIAPAAMQDIVANEAAQLQGGGVSDAAMEARLRGQVQQAMAGVPGVTPDNAERIAAEIIRELAQEVAQERMERHAMGMNQAQALRAMWAEIQQQRARAWRGFRQGVMPPTNIPRRP